MHLIDTSVGHLGSSSIVGGGISHAMGAAFAARMQGKDLVAVAFFGDAASEQGVFFETMSFSALKKLPVVFVCENNFYSVCSHISVRQPNDDIYKRARAFDIPSPSRSSGSGIASLRGSGSEPSENPSPSVSVILGSVPVVYTSAPSDNPSQSVSEFLGSVSILNS